MLTKKNLALGATALAAAGAIVGGGAAISNASNQGSGGAGYGYGGPGGYTATDGPGCQTGRGGDRGSHAHTEVTGAEATKVTEAVTAKDSTVTVESVRKDPDGSYDVLGTKDGQRVMVEVSADLATIEVRTGGPGGPRGDGQGRGGDGGHRGNSTTTPTASPSA
ncbi:hypothetical protein BJY21_001731 [Kineosphaera limosa]|uniref:PepSY domain-containing protein n=1 Tax=Kineosphaera limosa NBRC 100340 TaxID=1184609 RepID=K6WSA9_9MICO|nr:hypothetical protein [Kineosphaera limosa]NYE00547.1 hypothetical protein [Kineosphaera limosa]GAB94987.1 hypothetical protein KILIM_015_00470 [Kineosphaera limosa NBRC 100340]